MNEEYIYAYESRSDTGMSLWEARDKLTAAIQKAEGTL